MLLIFLLFIGIIAAETTPAKEGSAVIIKTHRRPKIRCDFIKRHTASITVELFMITFFALLWGTNIIWNICGFNNPDGFVKFVHNRKQDLNSDKLRKKDKLLILMPIIIFIIGLNVISNNINYIMNTTLNYVFGEEYAIEMKTKSGKRKYAFESEEEREEFIEQIRDLTKEATPETLGDERRNA
jgi:hypothetical protein